MSTKRQQVLEAIQQAGENGITTEAIRSAIGIDRHRLNVELWFFRNAGKITSAKIATKAIHVAAGVSIDKAKAALQADYAEIEAARKVRDAQRQRELRAKQAELSAGQPRKLSEAQLAQKRAAAERGRQRQKELGIKPPTPQKKPRLIQAKTQSINKLAERVKKERPSMTVESKKVAVSIDWSKAKRIECPSPPPRFQVQVVRGLFRSLGPGRYAAEPASCAARAAA